jgi:type IV pilus assembly protein PilM
MTMRIGFSNKKLLAVDWDRKSLRLVLIRPKGDDFDLVKAVSIPFTPEVRLDDAESLGAYLREAMRQARIKAKRAAFCIPREKVVLNSLQLPPTPAAELPALVQFQIVKELPFAADQAALDFAVAGDHDPKATCNVLVAAVRNEDLDFYKKLAVEAGLQVEWVGLRPSANLQAVAANTPDFAARNVLVVEVGPQLTEIDIVLKGRLAFSRSASVALPDFDAGPVQGVQDSRIISQGVGDQQDNEVSQRAVNDLMVDIIRSFEAFRATDPTVSVDHIVVCGACGIEPALTQSLAARFAAKAEMFSPERGLGLSERRARELRGFSAVLGLAMAHRVRGLTHVDFLHPKKVISKRSLQLKKLPIAIGTAAMFIVSGIVFHYKFIGPKQLQVQQLEKEREGKKAQEKNILEFKSQVDALEGWIESEQHWPEVLVAVTEVFPPEKEAFVSRVDLETKPPRKGTTRDSLLKLKFRTATLGTVNALTTKLSEAGFESIAPGKETHAESQGDIYSNDTSVDAVLPKRKPPASNGAAADSELLDSGAKDAPHPATTPPATSQPAGSKEPAPAAAKEASHAT